MVITGKTSDVFDEELHQHCRFQPSLLHQLLQGDAEVIGGDLAGEPAGDDTLHFDVCFLLHFEQNQPLRKPVFVCNATAAPLI